MEIEKMIEVVKELARKKKITVYLVGGYLRDKFLRRTSTDVDVVMEGDALEFARELARTCGYPEPVFYGRFGTAMIEYGKVKLELATCRTESYPEDSRKPEVFRAGIAEDLARRDFTINAIARNLLTGEILDPFGGRADLKARLIRTPVNPDKTFYDDPLRILRGVRFATRFHFDIEEGTWEAMKRHVFRLSIVSQERIAEELLKTLQASQPAAGLQLLDEMGALKLLLPEVAMFKEKATDHNCKDLFEHTLKTLDNISKHTRNVYLRLAMLLHDIGKPKTFKVEQGKVSFHRHELVGEKMSRYVCQRLKIGAAETNYIGKLIRYHLWPHLLAKENPTDKGLRRFIREVGKERKDLFTLARADLTSQNANKVRQALARLNELEKRIKEINRKDRLSCFRLAVDGHMIMEILGIGPGRLVGKIKDHLEQKVLEGSLRNTKRELKKELAEKGQEILQQLQADL